MNDNWYNCDNWYEPKEEKPEFVLPESFFKAERRRRIMMFIGLLLMLFACVLSVILLTGGYSSGSGSGGGTLPDSDSIYDFDSGNMPDDWHKYFDYIYSSAGTSSALVPLETVTERGELSLNVSRDGDTLDYGDIYKKCSPSVVYIKATVSGKSGYNWGSGIVASSDGYILTNTHVIEGCDSVEVGINGGKSYSAKLVGYDEDTDIAVLKIEAKGLTPATFAPTDTVSVGDTVIAIGNPLGESYRLTMTDGIVSALDRSVNYEGKTMRLLQTNAAINEGNSGGPLINDKGQVIGITNMKVISADSGVEGIGFAIPTDTILDIVSSIMSEGAVYGRATIGITVGVISDEVAKYYDLPNGLYVSFVNDMSDAYAQGLRKGDIITEVNGKACTETNDIAEAKNACDIGDTLDFTVWRDGETLSFSVKIMDAQDFNRA